MPRLGTLRSPVIRVRGEDCLLSGCRDARASKWDRRYACKRMTLNDRNSSDYALHAIGYVSIATREPARTPRSSLHWLRVDAPSIVRVHRRGGNAVSIGVVAVVNRILSGYKSHGVPCAIDIWNDEVGPRRVLWHKAPIWSASIHRDWRCSAAIGYR